MNVEVKRGLQTTSQLKKEQKGTGHVMVRLEEEEDVLH